MSYLSQMCVEDLETITRCGMQDVTVTKGLTGRDYDRLVLEKQLDVLRELKGDGDMFRQWCEG